VAKRRENPDPQRIAHDVSSEQKKLEQDYVPPSNVHADETEEDKRHIVPDQETD